MTRLWVLTVGTDRATAAPEHADCAGIDAYGPYDINAASMKAVEVRAEFAKHPARSFIYGQPVVEIIPFQPATDPVAGVNNWVQEDA